MAKIQPESEPDKHINKTKPKFRIKDIPPSPASLEINQELKSDTTAPKLSDEIKSPSLSDRAKKINEMLEKHPPETPVIRSVLTEVESPADKEKREKQEREAKKYRPS